MAQRTRGPQGATRRAPPRGQEEPVGARVEKRRHRVRLEIQRRDPRQLPGARNAGGAPAVADVAPTHRLLRYLDDSGERYRRVDGGLRRRPDEEGGIQEIPHTNDERRTTSGGAETT